MPSTSVAPANQSNLEAKQPKTPWVTGKVKAAIEAMVWQGLKRDQAAQLAGMKDNSLYVAFRRPEVKAFYLAQCEMLRLSGKARRIHRLNEMVEQDDNKAAVVNAAMALERMGDDNPASSLNNSRSPGVVVIIQQGGSGPAPSAVIGAQLTQPPQLTIDNDEISI
jgi:hypothetical protein